jgi:antitoxin HicB
MARDLLKILIEDCIEHRKQLPTPVKRGRGYRAVSLPALEEAKVALYAAVQGAGLRNAALARRLGKPVGHVDRLMNLRLQSRMDELEEAFRALGKSLVIEVRDAA